jgi:hypothetical protein
MLTPNEIKAKTKGHCRGFYNIMPIVNIPSVIKNGILSFYESQYISHASIALTPVQERREKVTIPNGGKLHSYANLYFTYHNPMMYKRREEAENLCVLAIDLSVLDIPECVLSDRNASTNLVKFYSPEDGFDKIDFDLVYAENWVDPNDHYFSKKAIKCAEILVPNCIPYSYIVGAYVLNEKSKELLLQQGFDKRIVINNKVFFR